MANGDDFDPDPNPVGTMTGLGLSPDDPLIDWASNMKPSDLQQYVHDPEGFKQNMINSGQPPPDHNYVQGPTGLQAVDQTGQPVSRAAKMDQNTPFNPLAPVRDPSQGNLTAPPPALKGNALAFGENPEGPSPWDEQIQRQIEGKPIGSKEVKPTPPGKTADRLPGMTGPTVGPGVPAPTPAPTPKVPPVVPSTTPPYKPEPEEAAPPDSKLATAQKEKEKADKKVEALSGEAVSDFAKSLQGVQVPKRPALPGVGTPGVRSPVGIQPGVQNLLALAGQGRPTPQQVSLMRLLGRG
jgi:hypothetical protein